MALLEHALEAIDEIEGSSADKAAPDLLTELRSLGLTDFSTLLAMLPHARFPRLSSVLPRMASEEVQKAWTGASGLVLLGQTIEFTNCAVANYTRITGKPFWQRRVLDFGCGYGRMLRPMYYYTHPDLLYGVDPWDRSIAICREDGLLGQLAVSDYVPKELPVDEGNFDFIYSFSVFTHLSERTARACLETLRRYVVSDGVLVITIRPIEYWYTVMAKIGDRQFGYGDPNHPYARSHRETGFAFCPHNRVPVDGDITYGDTSMTLAKLSTLAEGWNIVGTDRSLQDQLQTVVFLKPA